MIGCATTQRSRPSNPSEIADGSNPELELARIRARRRALIEAAKYLAFDLEPFRAALLNPDGALQCLRQFSAGRDFGHDVRNGATEKQVVRRQSVGDGTQ